MYNYNKKILINLYQVEKAFDYLYQYYNEIDSYVKFIVTCGTDGKKGIHIRNASENKSIDYTVTVEPVFLKNKDVGKLLNQLLNIIHKLNNILDYYEN